MQCLSRIVESSQALRSLGRKKGCKDESRKNRGNALSLKGLIRVRLADSSGEVTLLEKGMTANRPAAKLTSFYCEDRLAQRLTESRSNRKVKVGNEPASGRGGKKHRG